jgi:hypothetical protein
MSLLQVFLDTLTGDLRTGRLGKQPTDIPKRPFGAVRVAALFIMCVMGLLTV